MMVDAVVSAAVAAVAADPTADVETETTQVVAETPRTPAAAVEADPDETSHR